ncbi:glutamate--cysteine ligase [Blastococcus sp. BMG 814]|uniref:Putative glutamate--cysteine ligase 2 n=1 Tax=Blastococcus carthaginiensis TaxID=3050034 RepID=A0ABT9ICM6_9ACTN|nr:glutamate--cysteine ligase [Blastococcus carthaginiensis]MDP5183330.1 glutamate--cysteine ligase [Blastococcus carthaginiensis]
MGVEEELLVVDADGIPVARAPETLLIAARRGEGEDVHQHDLEEQGSDVDVPETAHLVPELKAQQLELGTPVCTTLAEVGAQLRHWRSRADAAASAVGSRVAALATSPVDVAPVPTEGERYGRLHEAFGRTAEEVLTCGCHVHVSVTDDEEGVAVLNRIRVWLPVLTALSANSPFWQGLDTSYASFRSQVWHRWPSAGPAGPFRDAGEYHRLVAAVLATRTVLDDGMVYFDARLSANWPTVEVRTADVLLRVEDVVTLTGLVRGLVETAARDARAGGAVPEMPAEVLRLAGWRASRSGLAGELVHPRTGRPAPAADVLADLLDHVRPALAEAGDERLVGDGVAALLARGTGADLQRQVHRETGDLAAVVRAAVEATTGEATPRAAAVASR